MGFSQSRLFRSGGDLEAISVAPGRLLALPGAPFGSPGRSGGGPGRSRGAPGRSRGAPGGALGALLALLGRSWALPGSVWAPLGTPGRSRRRFWVDFVDFRDDFLVGLGGDLWCALSCTRWRTLPILGSTLRSISRWRTWDSDEGARRAEWCDRCQCDWLAFGDSAR